MEATKSPLLVVSLCKSAPKDPAMAVLEKLLPSLGTNFGASWTQWSTLKSKASFAGEAPTFVLVSDSKVSAPERLARVVKKVRSLSKTIFICVWSPAICANPLQRIQLFEHDCHMITEDEEALKHALQTVDNQNKEIALTLGSGSRGFTCPYCKTKNLPEHALWHHVHLFHSNSQNIHGFNCEICGTDVSDHRNFAIHLHHFHAPPGHNEPYGRPKIQLYAFALVVCRHPDGRYLVVQEFCNSGYWLPGGGVDANEDLKKAAIRETKEEAGIDVNLTGILSFQFNARDKHARLRVIFMAEPKDPNQKPKSIPDFESVGASWISPKDVRNVPLRGSEPVEWFEYIESGGQVYPLELLRSRE